MRRHEITEKLAEALDLDVESVRGEYMTQYGVLDFCDMEVRRGHGDDEVVVGYLAIDGNPGDYFEDNDGAGELREFRDGAKMAAYIEELEAEGKLYLPVERYEHGLVHYSIADTKGYPDRRWDVAACGIMVPCDDVAERYAAGELTRDEVIADSNRVLDEYSDWCNGSVYGVILEHFQFHRTARAFDRSECDATWGHIGTEYAEQTLKSEMPVIPDEDPTPDEPGVDIHP